MSDLPTGTITFLFTDLATSTRLWEEHPQAMETALARHDELLGSAVRAHGRHVIKHTGDGLSSRSVDRGFRATRRVWMPPQGTVVARSC